LCRWGWYGRDGFVVVVVVVVVVVDVVVVVIGLMRVSIDVTRGTAGRCITYNYIHVDARQGEPAGVVGGGVRHVGCDVAVIRWCNRRITTQEDTESEMVCTDRD